MLGALKSSTTVQLKCRWCSRFLPSDYISLITLVTGSLCASSACRIHASPLRESARWR